MRLKIKTGLVFAHMGFIKGRVKAKGLFFIKKLGGGSSY